MSATRCVPQTTHTKGKKYSCGDGRYYWIQQEGAMCKWRRYLLIF